MTYEAFILLDKRQDKTFSEILKGIAEIEWINKQQAIVDFEEFKIVFKWVEDESVLEEANEIIQDFQEKCKDFEPSNKRIEVFNVGIDDDVICMESFMEFLQYFDKLELCKIFDISIGEFY